MKRRDSSSGFVLAFVLICLTVVTIALAAMIGRMSQGHRQIKQRQRQVQAQWLAESAIDRAAARLRRDPSYQGETWQLSPADLGDRWSAQISIQIEPPELGTLALIHVTVSVSPVGAAGRSMRKTSAYPDSQLRGSDMNQKSTSAFTLVELLVVIAIITILVLLLLPAINALRESARRTQCINNVSQLIIGIQGYEMSHGVYPAGVTNPSGPIVNQEQGFHHELADPTAASAGRVEPVPGNRPGGKRLR